MEIFFKESNFFQQKKCITRDRVVITVYVSHVQNTKKI